MNWRILFPLALSIILVACASPRSLKFQSGERELTVLGISPGPRGGIFKPGDPWKKEGTFVILTPAGNHKFSVYQVTRKIAPSTRLPRHSEILFISDQGEVQLAFTSAVHILDRDFDIVGSTFKCRWGGTKYEKSVNYIVGWGFQYTPCDSAFRKEAPGIALIEMDFERIAQVVQETGILAKIEGQGQADNRAQLLKDKVRFEQQVIDKSGLAPLSTPIYPVVNVEAQTGPDGRPKPVVVAFLRRTDFNRLDMEIIPASYTLDPADPKVDPVLRPKVIIKGAKYIDFERDLTFGNQDLSVQITNIQNGQTQSRVTFKLTNKSSGFMKVEKLAMRVGAKVNSVSLSEELAPSSTSAEPQTQTFSALLTGDLLTASMPLNVGVSVQYQIGSQQKTLNQEQRFKIGQLVR